VSYKHLLEASKKIQDDLTRWRRNFHQYPELGFQENRTSRFVADYLLALGLEVQTNIGKTGVVGLLRGKLPGKTIGLRADMDALPIPEDNQVEYRSTVPGIAHLCGHDAHTSMLLGAARVLTDLGRPEKGNIKFIFQPAEEGLAGADAMIQDGLLEQEPRIDAMAALHVNPLQDTGYLSVTRGVACASTDTIELKIIGKGGHAARPHQAVDAIAVAAQVINGIQYIASRLVDPLETVVVTIGQIEGGFMENVIAPEVKMRGTVRTLSPEIREQIPKLLHQTISGITASLGATYELVLHKGYPPVVNHDEMLDLITAASEELFNEVRWEYGKASTGGEDFAFYSEKVPAAMFRLGVSNGQSETSYPLHHPKFDLDEQALPIGTAILSAIGLRYLNI
jgi:amidohydrolase